MWHCFSRQFSADGNVVTSFNQKNKHRQPHSIRKQTKTASLNKETNKDNLNIKLKKITNHDNIIQLENKQRQPHQIKKNKQRQPH